MECNSTLKVDQHWGGIVYIDCSGSLFTATQVFVWKKMKI